MTVPVADFKAAEPDPLWRHAPRALRHLGEAHAPELLACVRAHDLPETVAVVTPRPRPLRLELAAIGLDGIRSVRLPFPGGPVRSLQEVTDGLRVLLACRCGTCGHRPHEV